MNEDGKMTGILKDAEPIGGITQEEYSQWKCQLQVIRAEELKPGDVIMVKTPREEMEGAAKFFDFALRGRNVQTLVMPLDFEVRLTRPPTLLVKK